jgi:hypothetical protein
MKKISLIILTVILNVALFSCTPENIIDEVQEQACCDGESTIPPPPPPPPGDDEVTGG